MGLGLASLVRGLPLFLGEPLEVELAQRATQLTHTHAVVQLAGEGVAVEGEVGEAVHVHEGGERREVGEIVVGEEEPLQRGQRLVRVRVRARVRVRVRVRARVKGER